MGSTGRLLGMRLQTGMAMLAMAAFAAAPMHALERLTLRSGLTQDCERHEAVGDNVRIYINGENYYEVRASEIVSVDVLPDPEPADPTVAVKVAKAGPLTREEMGEMLASAGQQHNIDA